MELSYEVIDQDNHLVGAGIVGGPPIKLLPGNYRLKLLGHSPKIFEDIQIEAEKLKYLTCKGERVMAQNENEKKHKRFDLSR